MMRKAMVYGYGIYTSTFQFLLFINNAFLIGVDLSIEILKRMTWIFTLSEFKNLAVNVQNFWKLSGYFFSVLSKCCKKQVYCKLDLVNLTQHLIQYIMTGSDSGLFECFYDPILYLGIIRINLIFIFKPKKPHQTLKWSPSCLD